MVVSMSAVVLLGFLVWMLWRHANVRLWHIAVCVLFGFYLASASVGPYIANAAEALAHFISRLHF